MLTVRATLASVRAELLVFRKWPVIWALLALPPVLNVVPYLGEYALYRTVTPAQSDIYGSPEQILRDLMPGLVLYETTPQFSLVGLAVFTLLGATIAGGDWGRGTVATSLLQASGRLSAMFGQLIAMLVAIVASVLATLAAGIASVELILAATPRGYALYPTAARLPSGSELGRGFAVFLLIAATFTAGGFLAGTLLRNTGGAIAVCLLYGVLLYPVLYNVGLEAGGPMRFLLDALPDTAAVSITSTFGENAGGLPNSMYYVVDPTHSIYILAAYALTFLVVTALVLLRRDIETSSSPHHVVRHASTVARNRSPTGASAHDVVRRPSGFLAAARADLYVLSRRASAWIFVLALPAYVLLNSYVVQYVIYLYADTGVFADVGSFQVLQTMLPDHVLSVILNDLGGVGGVDGTSPFLILGALITGSAWGRRTITTALLQGPTRLRSALGEVVVLAITVLASILLAFAVAFASTATVGFIAHGVVDPTTNPWPSPITALAALGTASAVAVTYVLAGATLGAIFRSAGGGIAAALLWTQVVRTTLDTVVTRVPGVPHALADVLPNAATTTLTRLFGVAQPDLVDPNVAHAQTGVSFILLAIYLTVFAMIPIVLTARRDIT